MALNLQPGLLLNALSGLLFMVAAAFVVRVAPRNRANVAFAVFAGGFGLRFFSTYVGLTIGDAPPWFRLFSLLGEMGIIVGATLAVLWFPSPPRARNPAAWATVLALALLMLAVLGWSATQVTPDAWARVSTVIGAPNEPYASRIVVLLAAFWTTILLVFFAVCLLRVIETGRNQDHDGRTILAAAAAGSYLASYYGTFGVVSPDLSSFYRLGLVLFVLACLSWIWWGGQGQHARATRNLGLYLLTLTLASAIIGATQGWPASVAGWQFGVARLLMIGIFAYATIRHQLLGLDLKVRWTIGKSALAGIFVATFFVASEVGQLYLGERAGSQYVGIVGAGLLVFAIHPLKRLADRIARAAVPARDEHAPRERREQVYRNALHIALRDRRLSEAERMHLAELADELGLGAKQTMALLAQAEQDARRPTSTSAAPSSRRRATRRYERR